jgi:hypothetical protein
MALNEDDTLPKPLGWTPKSSGGSRALMPGIRGAGASAQDLQGIRVLAAWTINLSAVEQFRHEANLLLQAVAFDNLENGRRAFYPQGYFVSAASLFRLLPTRLIRRAHICSAMLPCSSCVVWFPPSNKINSYLLASR